MKRSLEELLHEIGQDFSTPAVQVNAVAMKTPAVEMANLIMTLVQDKLPEHIASQLRVPDAGSFALAAARTAVPAG